MPQHLPSSQSKRSSVPPLPSPPGDPILGHLRYMPDPNHSDTVYQEWGRKYGDVFMLNVLGKNIVVINSEKAAIELMEKRSAIYSDRPPMPILERYLNDVVHGHRIRSWDDEYLKLAEDIDLLHATVNPSLMDISPYFEYLPPWFPGAWHVRYIKEARPILQNIIRWPVKRAWEELLAGRVSEPSFTTTSLEAASVDGKISDYDRWAIEMASSMILVGGIDTSLQTLQWFIACMLLNPDAQAKAQREIDEVVGRDRLPNFADRDSLPYVQYSLIAPLGIPHRSTAEDIYEGMRIPKGAIIIVNSRGINWDEKLFHEPHLFKPERFLPKPAGAGETFPESGVFGWGRRMCPGRHLADANIWLAIASILSVFRISNAKDTDGNPIKPDIEHETGLIPETVPVRHAPTGRQSFSAYKDLPIPLLN
ncbi:cytochrome P450 [Irpex lacteus]|nr:cytochrome P450 [Irpex lacteus]